MFDEKMNEVQLIYDHEINGPEISALIVPTVSDSSKLDDA
jgi:hypothetical protein